MGWLCALTGALGLVAVCWLRALLMEPGAGAAAKCCQMSFGDSTKGAAMVLLTNIFAS